jgi:hypothetical protein
MKNPPKTQLPAAPDTRAEVIAPAPCWPLDDETFVAHRRSRAVLMSHDWGRGPYQYAEPFYSRGAR